MRSSLAPETAQMEAVASTAANNAASAPEDELMEEEELLPRLGLRRTHTPTSFIYAASSLCVLKIASSGFATVALVSPGSTIDPYANVLLELLQVRTATHCWC
jgi:hypothetical protein